MSNLVGTEILTFPEKGEDGDIWVAGWVRRYIVSQGRTEDEAVKSLFEAIALTWLWDEELRAQGENVAPCPRTPPDEVEEWRELHAEAHPMVTP
jgi:hypothetical protein